MLGHRAVFLTGPEGDPSLDDGWSDIHVAGYAPYSLLFSRAAAIVHQGGVGTVHQALRSGRPQLVVPHLGDQYDNAARVVRLGCGMTLARARYRAETVASRLGALLGAPGITAQATAIAVETRIEDGAGTAADRIASLVRQPPEQL